MYDTLGVMSVCHSSSHSKMSNKDDNDVYYFVIALVYNLVSLIDWSSQEYNRREISCCQSPSWFVQIRWLCVILLSSVHLLKATEALEGGPAKEGIVETHNEMTQAFDGG